MSNHIENEMKLCLHAHTHKHARSLIRSLSFLVMGWHNGWNRDEFISSVITINQL